MLYLYSLSALVVSFASFAAIVDCESFVHTAGNRHFGQRGELFHDVLLFNKSAQDPANYSMAYRYEADSFSGIISYVELSVDGAEKSLADIDLNTNIDSTENRVVVASAEFVNATNLTARVLVRGFGGFSDGAFASLAPILQRKTFRRRSLAALCTNRTLDQRQQRRRLEYGARHENDSIVRFQRETVQADSSKYPSLAFDYADPRVNITYVALTMNTPGAIVFSNRVLLGAHQFRATIYELNKHNFSADMIVYGIRV